MSHDSWIFIASVALLVGYLIFSAKTEMGTKFGGKRTDRNKEDKA